MLAMCCQDDFFDSVVCCEGYEHVHRFEQPELMEEIYRVVRPNGVVLLTVPIIQGKHSGNKYHLHEPTLSEVEETIFGKFNIVRMVKPNVARYMLRPIK
jgi:ubiquinone/menaquinone biosynthesis C-methylase UbiE